MTQLEYTNIFESITDDKALAAELEFRADLMLVLREFFDAKRWNPTEIAGVLDIPQPRVSELVRGKVSKVSSDKLIGYLAKLGIRLKPTFVASARAKVPVKCSVRLEKSTYTV